MPEGSSSPPSSNRLALGTSPASQHISGPARTVRPISAISYLHFRTAKPLSMLHLDSKNPRTVRTNAQVIPSMEGPFSALAVSPGHSAAIFDNFMNGRRRHPPRVPPTNRDCPPTFFDFVRTFSDFAPTFCDFRSRNFDFLRLFMVFLDFIGGIPCTNPQ